MATTEQRTTGASASKSESRHGERSSTVFGFGAGLRGGVLMAAILVILAIARGDGALASFQVIASTLVGGANSAGSGGEVFGLAAHFAFSALFGAVFVRIVGRTSRRRMLGYGLLYSIFIWIVMQFIMLPILDGYAATRLDVLWPFFLGHLGYGLMLAASLPATDDIDAAQPAKALETEPVDEQRGERQE